MKDSYELEDDSTINESFESEFPTSAVEILAANMTPVVRDRWVIKEAPFDDIKKIVADKSMMTVKFPDGKQKVDMMTANVLMTVYNALNDKTRRSSSRRSMRRWVTSSSWFSSHTTQSIQSEVNHA